MKTQKLPKTVWVGFNGEMNPINAVCDKRNYRLCCRLARYHLHPGNEVRLKRENAAMRKWIIQENGGKRSVKKCPCLRCKKLREVVTDL